MLYGLAARALARMEPEAAQQLALQAVALSGRPDAPGAALSLRRLAARLAVPDQREGGLRRKLFGCNLSGLVGLAAGADKNGTAIAGWQRLGFGFVELGTVTVRSRLGNTGPRIWRHPDQYALVNFMGLPNNGYLALQKRLQTFRAAEHRRSAAEPFCIGVSLSRQPGDTLDELATMTRALQPHADYFTLNVSCPNVSSHSAVDAMEALSTNIEELQTVQQAMRVTVRGARRPVLVKLAPTAGLASLDAATRAFWQLGANGFVATNTVAADRRALLPDVLQPQDWQKGGYSGPGLRPIGLGMVGAIRRAAPRAIVIGVGGIQSAKDAVRYLEAGADAVQLYTGLVMQGPVLVKRINRALRP